MDSTHSAELSQSLAKSLLKEVEYFHRSIFGFDVSEEFKGLYLQAHQFYFKNMTEAERNTLRIIVDRRLPLAPCELVSRARFPLLAKKINVLIYIAEALDGYQRFFVDPKTSRWQAFARLSWAACLVPFQYLYGIALGKRYGIF